MAFALNRQPGPPGSTGHDGRRRRPLALAVRAMAVLALAAGVWLAWDFVHFARAVSGMTEPSPASLRGAAASGGIVVLTGGAQRLPDAAALLQNGHGQRLLITGVHEKTGKEEIARATGMPMTLLECCVDLDKRARNTIGNAIEARRWAELHGFRSLFVVTSNYHMPRTLDEFRHAIKGVSMHGVPVVTDHTASSRLWTDPGMLRLALLEYAKLMVTRARHLIEADPENSRLPTMLGRQKPVATDLAPSADGGAKRAPAS